MGDPRSATMSFQSNNPSTSTSSVFPETGTDEDVAKAADSQDAADTQTMDESSQLQSPAEDGADQPSSQVKVPVQKRRRVTRACDECRRKKIKVSKHKSRRHISICCLARVLISGTGARPCQAVVVGL